MRTASERFDQKVRQADDGTDCLIWTACKQPNGYGKFGFEYRTVLAHRWAFERHHGVTLTSDQLILHSCDRPSCVNVDHLRIGTYADNIHDMDERGRRNPNGAKGEINGQSKLTGQTVAEARALHSAGSHSYSSLARRYGVSVVAVRYAIIGRTWKHVA